MAASVISSRLGARAASLTFLLQLGLAAAACEEGGGPDPVDAGTDLGVDLGVDAGDPDVGVTDVGVDSGFTGVPCANLPGLYVAGSCETLASGIVPFAPRYVLWSDGATKDRFVYLPPGQTIDATDPDAWVFPIGTTFWKHFSLDGQRLETRYLKKTGQTAWEMRTFQWQAHGQDVVEVTGGVTNTLGTTHDIPTSAPFGGECAECHRTKDMSLGFSAIQLNHAGAGLPLTYLMANNLLANLPSGFTAAQANVPGVDPVATEALGYMHANCGHCHLGAGGVVARGSMRLWVPVGLTALVDTPTYMDTINQLAIWQYQNQNVNRVVPGSPGTSAISIRMHSRANGTAMPWLATEIVHPEGMAAVDAWIQSLP